MAARNMHNINPEKTMASRFFGICWVSWFAQDAPGACFDAELFEGALARMSASDEPMVNAKRQKRTPRVGVVRVVAGKGPLLTRDDRHHPG